MTDFPSSPETERDAALVRDLALAFAAGRYEGGETLFDMYANIALKFMETRGLTQSPADSGEIEFEYCNWEGRKSLRRARPISIRFGKSEWHPTPQWLMRAFDPDKGEEREFAMQDMAFEEDVLAALSLSSTSSEGK